MFSLPIVQNGHYFKESWQQVAPYATPPIAASIAIVPIFYGFMLKSALQLNQPVPNFEWSVIRGGLRASPTIGMIVGTQMIAQDRIEKCVMKAINNPDPKGFMSMFISAALVGLISAPALAIFNGQTIKDRTMKDSLRMLSKRQVLAIVSRETSFLFALRISNPASDAMKNITGDNKMTEIGSAFLSGVIGSMIGHPADTALTLWQKNMKIISARQLLRGSIPKALAVGGFSVLYNAISETLQYKQ